MIVPGMGRLRKATPKGLGGALFTPVQQRLLGLLFGQPARRFQSAEIIRMAAGGTGAVHRQLQRLADAGLLITTRDGNQKYYQANGRSPIFPELRGLVQKTIGVVEPLRRALAPVAKRVEAAFVFGSTAKKTDRSDSDLDLLIVSDELTYPEAYEALLEAERVIGRPMNPVVMTRAEWTRKRSAADSFVKRIAAQPKLFVIGDEHALA
jgi:predicted nucleotidyltransferase